MKSIHPNTKVSTELLEHYWSQCGLDGDLENLELRAHNFALAMYMLEGLIGESASALNRDATAALMQLVSEYALNTWMATNRALHDANPNLKIV